MKGMKKVVTLPAGTKYHWNRSPEEVKDIYSRLPPLDDAGEPTIVNSTGTSHLNEPTIVTITKTRKIDWHSWFNKPKFLVEGLTTINGNPKIIMFSLPPNEFFRLEEEEVIVNASRVRRPVAR